MKKKTFKSVLSLVLIGVLFAAMTLSMGCGKKDNAAASTEVTANQYPASGETIGEGNTQFTFVITDKDGNETTYTINTDAATVGEALTSLNLIEGEESEWGLYVKTVIGITADYDVDQTYWAFYIDGEYAMTGVDATEVTAGSTYAFKVE